MGDNSAIEWTDATWNPVVGCSIVSPGCTNCYAMKQAARLLDGNPKSPHYAGTTKRVNDNAVWTGKVALAPDNILTAPLRWKKPRRIFVNSMGDLFHENVPDAWIDKAFAVMALAPQHTFQCLTKRSKRMREYMDGGWSLRIIDRLTGYAADWLAGGTYILPNVWLGVSVEDQTHADERIPDLLATPAAVRFVSAEPLLGPVDFENVSGADSLRGFATDDSADRHRLDWVICGGESGPGARPMHPDWVRSIRDQCAAAGVPFLFKQWGNWLPGTYSSSRHTIIFDDNADADGMTLGPPPHHSSYVHEWKDGSISVNCGKSLAGRTLDGVIHDAFPESRQ